MTTHPQYFFLSTMSFVSKAKNTSYIGICASNKFKKGAARLKAAAKVKKIVKKWINTASSYKNKYKKVKFFNDKLCKWIKYSVNSALNQNCYSAFVNKKTVCAGYSMAFELLCNLSGIECLCVTSTEHQWNLVKLNGKWYNIDVTWSDNDADSGMLYYDFFLKSNGTLKNNDDQNYHNRESFWNGYLPKCPQNYPVDIDEPDDGTDETENDDLKRRQPFLFYDRFCHIISLPSHVRSAPVLDG